MKKLILLVFLVMSLGLVYAELEIDIPFDMDMIGDDFSAVGPYSYESDWITITNIGSTNETYTIAWSYSDLPAGWTASVCNDIGLCFIPNMPSDVTINAGESLLVHFVLGVNSTGGCGLNITLDEGDLTEPIVLDFTFNTEDNVSAEDGLVLARKLGQNYPNPFNPSTTIAFELTSQEMESAVINIFNVKGQIVKTFAQLSGNSIIWIGTDDNGKNVNNGIYFYQLQTGDKTATKKMVLMK